MKILKPAILGLGCLLIVLGSSSLTHAQEINFNYRYRFEPTFFDTPPEMGGLEVAFPDAARKNGVEGTVKVDFTMGEDGKIRDILIVQDLPFGVGDSVKNALEKFYFKPALSSGKPVPMKAHIEYVVTMAYSDGDKNVTKPQITEKPEPEYPANHATEKLKGKVDVSVMFYADGTLKVLGTNSVMPREFDKAASAAAAKIKFTPANHKKTKKPVAQQMVVTYEFKP